MNDHELESFEAELRALKPAPPPPELLARLETASPIKELTPPRPALRARWQAPNFWRWFAPATAVVALALAFGIGRWQHGPAPKQAATPPQVPASPDVVEIDRQLVASYDAIAEVSGGIPVRFHCQEWEDKVFFRDPLRGIAIERRTPRLEVVPVSLETY
jgi:anti-sigma-K factor RskA